MNCAQKQTRACGVVLVLCIEIDLDAPSARSRITHSLHHPISLPSVIADEPTGVVGGLELLADWHSWLTGIADWHSWLA